MTFHFSSDVIIQNTPRQPNLEDAINYFDSMATYTDELRKLQRQLRDHIGYDCIINFSYILYPYHLSI